MKAAIYCRVMEEEQQHQVQVFFDELAKQKIEPIIWQLFYDQIREKINLPPEVRTFSIAENLTSDIEFIISLGGDGTLLDTVTLVRHNNIPIMGINFGRLGFLASIGRDEVAVALKALNKRSYIMDERTMIHLDADLPLFGEVPYALNEFAVHKRDTDPMIKIHTYLNGEFLNTSWANPRSETINEMAITAMTAKNFFLI